MIYPRCCHPGWDPFMDLTFTLYDKLTYCNTMKLGSWINHNFVGDMLLPPKTAGDVFVWAGTVA